MSKAIQVYDDGKLVDIPEEEIEKNSSKIKGIIVAWDLISTKGYNTWKKDKNWKKNGKYIFYRDITRSRIVKEVSRK